jgi:gamma-glutamylaminecyclotransferase
VIVFVYGSLLRGEDNHAVLEGARFLGEAWTAPRYALIDLGQYPGLVAEGGAAVRGELYELEEEAVGTLDDFEGHPHDYMRCAIELSDGGFAHAYLTPPERAAGRPRVASGSWRDRNLSR